jgi:WH2 motif
MMVYSTEQVDLTPKASSSNIPPAPPAPPASTEQGPPSNLFDQIRNGSKLRKTETVVKTGIESGKIIGETETPSLMEALSNKLNKIRPMITGDESELEESKSGQD